MTALIARQYIDGSKADTPSGVSVANFQLGLGNAWDCLQTLGVGLAAVVAGTTALTQANAGLLLIDATAGNVILNLPAASAAVGAVFQFKRLDSTANTVTVNRAGSDTIDGSTSFTLNSQFDYQEIRADGTSAWRVTTLKPLVVTTVGIATAYTVTTTPKVLAQADTRIQVTWNVSNGGVACTLAANGGTAYGIKQYDSTGTKIDPTIVAGVKADLVFDGTHWVILDPLPPSGTSAGVVQGAFKNLQASSTGLNANVSVTVDEVAVENASNAYQTLRNVSLTINSAGAGANGLDTGSIAASTWYSVWVIWNGTTTAGLLSLSSTAPTMPGGYTHKARVGWIRTDGTANKFPLAFKQMGRRVQYVVAAGSNVAALPQLGSGVQGSPSTPTYVALAVGNFVPPTSAAVRISLYGFCTGQVAQVAPNGSYGPTGATNPPPFSIGDGTTSGWISSEGDILLESTNIFYASNASNAYVLCRGWEDNL